MLAEKGGHRLETHKTRPKSTHLHHRYRQINFTSYSLSERLGRSYLCALLCQCSQSFAPLWLPCFALCLLPIRYLENFRFLSVQLTLGRPEERASRSNIKCLGHFVVKRVMRSYFSFLGGRCALSLGPLPFAVRSVAIRRVYSPVSEIT